MALICKNGLWRVYATQWVRLGLWSGCVSYACENCVLYAGQTRVYHMHAKVNFCISIPRVFVFIWRTIYTHFHETGLVFSSIFSLYQTIWAIKSWCIKYDTHQKSQQRFYKLLHFKTLDFSGYYSFFNSLHTFSKHCLFFSKLYTQIQELHTKWSTAFKISQTHLKSKHLQTPLP